MATNFSPCNGFFVLNQFASNGFHVSASGAIQGHHGPLVLKDLSCRQVKSKSLFGKGLTNDKILF